MIETFEVADAWQLAFFGVFFTRDFLARTADTDTMRTVVARSSAAMSAKGWLTCTSSVA